MRRTAGAGATTVRVIPTCVEESAYRPKSVGASPAGRLEMVWIGSSSTLNGLERQRTLFERLGREVPGLRLRMICDRFLEFASLPVVPVTWDERTEADELSRGDVGISWVPDDRWSRGKCGLKVLQFQAAGLPVVANPVGVHTRMIEPGTSGFLADTADDWVTAFGPWRSTRPCEPRWAARPGPIWKRITRSERGPARSSRQFSARRRAPSRTWAGKALGLATSRPD